MLTILKVLSTVFKEVSKGYGRVSEGQLRLMLNELKLGAKLRWEARASRTAEDDPSYILLLY